MIFGNLWRKNSELLEILPEVRGKYLCNVNMSKHTWFGVGGMAEVMFLPADSEDLKNFLLLKPKGVPMMVLGGGSNLLVRDGGLPGVVVKLDNLNFSKVSVKGYQVTVGAGLRNVNLKKSLIENGIGGLEFLCSIPGRIGGLLRTNAGCFGSSVSDVLVKAKIMNDWGEIYEVDGNDFHFSYRGSMFPENWVILEATFQGKRSQKEVIEETLKTQHDYRLAHQPINQKTGGSTFKNPEGLAAWKLISESGAKDIKVGGAIVSPMHCNFLINTGNATADDIENLGEKIIATVYEKTAVTLEWEIRRVGVKK